MTRSLYPRPAFFQVKGPAGIPTSGIEVSGASGILAELQDSLVSLGRMCNLAIAAGHSGQVSEDKRADTFTVLLESVCEDYFDGAGCPAAEGRSPAPSKFDERYELLCEDGFAVARATGSAGFRYALVALMQLAHGNHPLPQVHIIDGPHLAWRGLSLDVSRHFYSINELQSFVDLLLWNRANVLHLHLTDNQAWRIEAAGFPNLTPEGSDFYTEADLMGLAKYALQRGVTLVPEVDIPGHVGSALREYPEMSGGQKFSSDLSAYLSVDDGTARRLVEASVASVAHWNPAAYVHIGGDEALGMPKGEYRRAIQFGVEQVEKLGFLPITWQEGIHSEALTRESLVQFWQSPYDAFNPEEAKEGFPEDMQDLIPLFDAMSKRAMTDSTLIGRERLGVIASPSNPAYLDRRYLERSQDEQQNAEMKTVGFPAYHPIPLDWVLDWDPHKDRTLAEMSLQGVEAALWGETIESMDDAALLLLPRFPIIAAAAWGRPWGSREETARSLLTQSPVWERLGFRNWYRNEGLFEYASR